MELQPNPNLINITCAASGESEKITIILKGDREHSESDDSDFIKKLKATGIVSADDFQWSGGYISGSHSVMLDDSKGKGRNFMYEWLYIERHDQQTRDQLLDKQFIRFDLGDQKECIDIESDDEDDNESDTQYIRYDQFIQDGMNIPSLNGADDLVLACSRCNIHFDYPCFDNVTYTIRAEDEVVGFTRKELALKIMQLYCMMVFVCKKYDKTTGQLYQSEPNPPKFSELMFGPVLGVSEWEDNGIRGITYDKEKNHWVCLCVNYI